ncbi:RNA polymerase, sigma 54 subunit, RpoN/SigL [Spirosomataceae bacterium TFI 002]|nr:RNA polymerase, sigma 54 subunit, RpoN/SigL [Spirosomataceae bacterium TFI 002]
MNIFSQVQSQKQGLRINPQQIQFLNFLYFNRQEFEENIKKEILENPFLQEQPSSSPEKVNIDENFDQNGPRNTSEMNDHSSSSNEDFYKSRKNDLNADLEDWKDRKNANRTKDDSFQEEIFKQFRFLCKTPQARVIGKFIIYNTNNRGFLNCDIDRLVDDISFSKGKVYEAAEVLRVKKMINEIEPYGFAAFDLKDYLIIKITLEHQGPKIIREKAIRLLNENFELLVSHDYSKIEEQFDYSKEDIFEIVKLIKSIPPMLLDGADNHASENHSVVPDYRILENNGKLFSYLIGKGKYALDLNSDYISAIERTSDKKAKTYAESKIKSALWYIDAIKQREETMTAVIKTIAMLQADYLMSGDPKDLKPMRLKDVASLIDMTISTVSRVTSNKYAETPLGVINLKDLFSEKIKMDNGKEVSNVEVQSKVRDLILNEDKSSPLSDKAIQELLIEEGISLTRRTITKYRLSENIPSSNQRKQIVL